ncbi:GNAT family N-acetyltransferase [Paenibacillus sp. P96]|uniref:GNAT family N-acetyltransferase n=1 Tax=Paenibacillus zeirhizosphaerae TaxID=2987519 RepID=A0ABT9FU69_9BACL|nr:GNAT family N-acetyltransferase [Paenibacillus sp. P96]MDP4098165.1 GNAT family N-acetyltransferase [Paenibacillus sp. P96]
MELFHYADAKEFYAEAEQFLIKSEIENNLTIGVLRAVIGNTSDSQVPCMLLVKEKNEVILTFTMRGSHTAIIGYGSEVDAIDLIINYMSTNNMKIKRVTADYELSTYFSKQWTTCTGQSSVVRVDQIIYATNGIVERKSIPGTLKKAVIEEEDNISEIIYKFFEETGQKISFEVARKKANLSILNEDLFVWHDGEIVCVAKKVRETPNCAIISMVYTPKPYRSKGYASACVSELSKQLLLKGYRYCILHADSDNHISTNLYESIGYHAVGRLITYHFFYE